MTKNIAYFLELEDGEFDLDEAMEYYRDMKVESAPYEDHAKYLAKLDKRIKEYIKASGQVPQVSNVRTDIIPKKPTKKVDVVKTEILAGKVLAMGQLEISQMILDLIEEKPNRPAIKFVFEDLVYK